MKNFIAGAFCALSTTIIVAAPTVAEAQDVTLNLSTIMLPGDPFVAASELFGERLDELSGGTMEVNIFDSGSLFPQGASFDALSRGQVEMSDTNMGSYSQQVPYTDMFLSAYMFEGPDHAREFWASDLGQRVFDDVAEATNIRILGQITYGSRQISLTGNVERTIQTPADLEGVKLRMPSPPAWMALGRALGVDPTPLAFNEVYLAMQTGTVDGQDNTLTVSKAAGLIELTEQVVLTDHQAYSQFFGINEELWQSFSDEQRGWVQTALDEGIELGTQLAQEAEATLQQEYRDAGAQIITPDIQAFIDHARAFYEDNPELTENWDRDLIAQINAMVE